jgi:Mrp family chromosome partitioning ATPase/capsular polysaccharide biosynthesis protein
MSNRQLPDFEGTSLLESVWRHKVLIVVVALLFGTLGYAQADRQEPRFESTARMILTDPRSAGLFGELKGAVEPARYVRNQQELIESGAVYPRVSELLDGRLTPGQLRGHVTVSSDANADVLVVTGIDSTAEGAQEVADAVTEAYQDVVVDQVAVTTERAVAELEERNDALRQSIQDLPAAGDDPAAAAERTAALDQLTGNENRIAQLRVDAALFASGVDHLAPAEAPAGPVHPAPRRNAVIWFIFGAALATGVAWWRTAASRQAELPGDVAPALGAPLLGEIPDFARVGVSGQQPTVDEPLSPAAEAFQYVASSLTFALAESEGGRSILVTSVEPGDGKSVVTLNLAVATARDGRRTIVVDADKRRSGLTRLCGLVPEKDLVNKRLQLAPELDISLVSIGVGVTDPAGFFRTNRFRTALASVKERGDLVLVDAPPLLSVPETSVIAAQVDGIVVVIPQGTPIRRIEELRERLEFIGTPVFGYVYNRSRTSLRSYGRRAYGVGASGLRRWRAAGSRRRETGSPPGEAPAEPAVRPEVVTPPASPRVPDREVV